MKHTLIAACVAVATLAACGTTDTAGNVTAAPVPVGPGEYLMTHNGFGVRAYVYGGVTVIEWPESVPNLITIRDAAGSAVPGEVMGRYLRTDRRLERFSLARMGVELVAGHLPGAAPAVKTPASTQPGADAQAQGAATRTAPTAIALTTATQPTRVVVPVASEQLIRHAESEIALIRRLLASGKRNPRAQAEAIRRIDALERRLAQVTQPVTVAAR